MGVTGYRGNEGLDSDTPTLPHSDTETKQVTHDRTDEKAAAPGTSKAYEWSLYGQWLLRMAASEGEGGALSTSPTALYGDNHYFNIHASETGMLGFNFDGPDAAARDLISASYGGGYYLMESGTLDQIRPDAERTQFGFVPLGDYTWTHHWSTRPVSADGWTFSDATLSTRVGGGGTYYLSHSDNIWLGDFASMTSSAHAALYVKPWAYASLDTEVFASFEREQTVQNENTGFGLDIYGVKFTHWTKLYPQTPLYADTPERSQMLRRWFPSAAQERRVQLYHQGSVTISRSTAQSNLYGAGQGRFVDLLSEPTLALANTSLMLRLGYHFGAYDSPQFQSQTQSLEWGFSIKQALGSHWYLQPIYKQNLLLSSQFDGAPQDQKQADLHFYLLLGHAFFGRHTP
jgi:hypothetical protein